MGRIWLFPHNRLYIIWRCQAYTYITCTSHELCTYMMTSSNGNIFCVTGLMRGEFTGHRWIPRTTASDAELWCFLWSAPEPTDEQTMEMPVIWDAIELIMTSLQWVSTLLFCVVFRYRWILPWVIQGYFTDSGAIILLRGTLNTWIGESATLQIIISNYSETYNVKWTVIRVWVIEYRSFMWCLIEVFKIQLHHRQYWWIGSRNHD